MKVNTRKLAIFSLFTNAVLILVGSYFISKRWQFQNHQDQEGITYSRLYKDNPQYTEQISLELSYKKIGRIVMLGNSLIYKVQWNELLNRNDVINRGIGSDITAGYLPRLNLILNSHPSICFLEGGVNDLDHHIPIDTIIYHLSQIIDTFQSNHIIPVLHSIIYVTSSYYNGAQFNNKIRQLNVRINKLSAEKKVDLIDLNPYLSENEFLKPEYSQADGIHLTGTAYLVWKSFIDKILQKYNL